MYTLRNIEIGSSYTRIQRGESSVFDNLLNDYPEYAKVSIRAFLLFGNGEVYPVSLKMTQFITGLIL